jgi:hypothetical protein
VRSTEGLTTSQVSFVNDGTSEATVLWIDYSGARVFYSTVQSGDTLDQPTYLTHPWVVVDDAGECLGYTVSTKESQTLRVG